MSLSEDISFLTADPNSTIWSGSTFRITRLSVFSRRRASTPVYRVERA